MINVKIDIVKDLIEVVNPITGKIEKGNVVKTLVETDAFQDNLISDNNDLVSENKALLKKVAFLETKVSTLSIEDWNDYKGLA